MKHLKFFSLALSMVVLFSCHKEHAGASTFEIDQPASTLFFQYGQRVLLNYTAENLEVLTVKAPTGWKAWAENGELAIIAPDAGTGSSAVSGRVGIYARGFDKEEYAFYIPVRSESPQTLTDGSIVYCSSFSDDALPENLLDGDDFTYWRSADGVKGPFYIILDLGKTFDISSIGIRALDAGNGIPMRQCAEAMIDFATEIHGDGMADLGGKGGGNWTDRHLFYSDLLKNEIVNIAPLRAAVSARYIRIGYLKAWLDDTSISPFGVTDARLSGIEIYCYQ